MNKYGILSIHIKILSEAFKTLQNKIIVVGILHGQVLYPVVPCRYYNKPVLSSILLNPARFTIP